MGIVLWIGALLLARLAAAQPVESLEANWRLESTIAIAADLHHVQGIDVEGDSLWISSVDAPAGKGYLTRLELRTGRVVSQVEVQDGRRIHPGGIALDGDSIWMPVAEYHRGGPSWVERRDKKSLKLRSRFEVADHIGCIAASKGELVGGSWGSRTVYRWSKAGKELERRPNPFTTEWQDLKFASQLLLASGNASKTEGAIEWIALPEMALKRRVTAGVTDRKVTYTHEGMALRGGRLYLLPEDAPTRLFVFVAK